MKDENMAKIGSSAAGSLRRSPMGGSSPDREVVGLSGFEPLTSRLSGVRSNQLSYRPLQNGKL